MRKLLIAAILLLLLSTTVFAAETTVKSLETECTVAQDGSCTVVLTAELHFAEGTQDFAIPVSAKAKNISLGEYRFDKERVEDYYLLHLQSEQGFSGDKKLTVSYRLAETVSDKSGQQEFSLMLLYPAWSCPIEAYKATLSFPEPFESLPVLLSGYYGDLIDNYMDIQIEDGVIRAELDASQSLQDHESLQLSLTLPQDYFDLRFLSGKATTVARLLFWLLCLLCPVYWVIFLRSRPISPKRQAMPPVGGNAGAVPYILCGKKAELPYMILQWASLGYLTVHRTRKGKLFLRRQIDMGNERKSYEVTIFRALFRRKDDCDVRSEAYFTARQLAAELTEKYYKNKLFVPFAGRPGILRALGILAGMVLSIHMLDLLVAPQSWRWFAILPLSVLGGVSCYLIQMLGGFTLRSHRLRTVLLALFAAAYLTVLAQLTGNLGYWLVCLLLQLLIGLSLRLGGRRTASGRAHASELLGLRRYLISTPSEVFRANLRSDPQYFYQILPYAEVLRVGKLFAASFDRAPLESCDWLVWEGKTPKYAMPFYARFRRLMAGLRGENISNPAPKNRPRPRSEAEV